MSNQESQSTLFGKWAATGVTDQIREACLSEINSSDDSSSKPTKVNHAHATQGETNKISNKEWIIDGGALNHMTEDCKLFHKLYPLAGKGIVSLLNKHC